MGKMAFGNFLAVLFCTAGALAQANFDWSLLTPSDNLTWIDCYTAPIQCTRFSVPFNYTDSAAGSAALALIRIPATLNDTTNYRGPVLFNPGGPGGSGVDAILSLGQQIASVVGAQFDLVSFDPRGVGHSTPNISFFKTDVERAAFDFGARFIDATDGGSVIPRQWAQAQVIARLAKDRDPSNFYSHVTTDNVAQDMLKIVEAHGQTKIQYWGISYGTVIGTTFAAMFPDKIERLIIDGVLDMEGYYASDWSNEAIDTDKTLQTFFDGCVKAGPTLCAFHASTSKMISARLDALFTMVKAQPVPAYSASLPAYGTVDTVVLRSALFTALYTPYDSFATLAQGLALLEKGDGSVVYQLGSGPRSSEVVLAVACADGTPVTDDATALEKYAARISNISSFAGEFAGIRITCSGWKFNPNNFRGPITGNTSFPLLVIGNTADPVTPLVNAKKIALKFPGAVVLTQDSPGHTSFSVVSNCTVAYVNQYFQNGTFPPQGTVCPVPTPLFPNSTAVTQNSTTTQNSTAARRSVGEVNVAIDSRSLGSSIFGPGL